MSEPDKKEQPWARAEEELMERLVEVQRIKAVHDKGDWGPELSGDILEFRRTLTSETDRGCALHATAYIDVHLRTMLEAVLVEDPNTTKVVFGPQGALHTFSTRIEVGFLLGMLSRQDVGELTRLRKIRNAFAHHPAHIRFDEPPIVDHCNNLEFTHRGQTGARSKFCTSVMAILARIRGSTEGASRRPLLADVDLDAWRDEVDDLAAEKFGVRAEKT